MTRSAGVRPEVLLIPALPACPVPKHNDQAHDGNDYAPNVQTLSSAGNKPQR
jgi:hypothetical protein